MRHALHSLLAGAALALAAGAAAGEEASEPSRLELHGRSMLASLRQVVPGVPAVRSGTGFAVAPHWFGLRLWATGAGYAVGRRSAGYGLGAGAALPILERLAFTAGYRITGYSSGAHLDGDVELVDEQVAGAYLGFDLEF